MCGIEALNISLLFFFSFCTYKRHKPMNEKNGKHEKEIRKVEKEVRKFLCHTITGEPTLFSVIKV